MYCYVDLLSDMPQLVKRRMLFMIRGKIYGSSGAANKTMKSED